MSDKVGLATDELRNAVDRAVEHTAELVASLELEVESAFKRALAGGEGSPETRALHQRIRKSIRRHHKDAGRFRMVLFGRTGAGKSSLIEALSGGKGSSISTGVSDFTTEPRQVSWGPLELVDTPGVAGWGRTRTTAELEAVAADAVASADLVLLTFDSMNQQSSEFDAAHRQIQRYGRRPCVAVLNIRNGHWRDPSTPAKQARRHQQQVESSARYLQDMLNQVGLGEVPILAVHSQNAVAALADADYRGPDANLIRARREKRGLVALEDASNVRPLIKVLTQALVSGAPELRAQALRQDVAGQVAIALGDMEAVITELDRAHQIAVSSLAETLSVIGGGDRPEQTLRPGRWHRSVLGETDWIAECVDDFQALDARVDGAGELQAVMDQVLAIHLNKAVRELRGSGDRAVQKALAAGGEVSGEQLIDDLRPAVDQLDTSAKICVDLLADTFADRLGGLELGFHLKLDFERFRESTFRARADRNGARAWAATEVLSAVVGAVALFASGPVGWSIAAGALVTGWLSGRKRRQSFAKAESKDVQAHARIVDTIRSEVSKLAESARSSVHAAVEKMASELATTVIPDLGSSIVQTRHRRDQLAAEIVELRALTESGPELLGAEVIRASAAAVRDQPAHGSRLDPLLGARTVDGEGASTEVDYPAVDLGALVLDLEARAAAAAVDLLDKDADHTSATNKTSTPNARRRPVVGIVGRRRVGTSSLARALQREGKHGWITRTVTQDGTNASRCDLLIWLFAPNPTTADHAAFETLLGPDALTRSHTLARSIFVIGQADALAQDPVVDPHAYQGLIDRKARELADLLRTHGLEISPDSILCTMARPFGFSLSDSPERHPVSGIPQLATVLTPQVARHTEASRMRHEVIHRTAAKLARATLRAEDASRRLSGLDESIALATAAVEDTRRLVAEFESSAFTTIGDYVDGLALAVTNATTAAQLRPRLDRLNSWPEHEQVFRIMTDWEREFSAAQHRVSQALVEDLDAAVQTAGLDRSGLGLGVGKERDDIGKHVGRAASIVRGASKNRDAWYQAVKFVGGGKFKFKPWGAVKGAKAASKFGVALAAVGVVITIAELGFDARARSQRKKVREEVLQKSRANVTAVLRAYLWVDEEGSGQGWGPLRFASNRAKALQQDIAPLRKERDVVARRFERAVASRESALSELKLSSGDKS